ncbi:MAG: N-glycosylase/DNA lyase [Endomicrobiales bacterium]|nr:N-glycosylase/DNA lyase [Endomicrobiales bacterium]
MKNIETIKKSWIKKRAEINKRLSEFEEIWRSGTDMEIFCELVFCLFTPQSKAKTCWAAVNKLKGKNLINSCRQNETADILGTSGVRFKNNKTKYLIEAKKLFTSNGKMAIKQKLEGFRDVFELREWLVENIKGLGYKEASHFLRNLGFGKDITILDRHILKNLKAFGVIKKIPKTITKNTYMEIEDKMRKFAHKIKVPLSHLDLIFWYNETGEIFK